MDIITIAIWICSVAGTLFICYSFATFILRKIDNFIRLIVSLLFLAMGFLLFSVVGSILSGRAIQFTILGLTIVVLLSILGLTFVYLLYRHSTRQLKDGKNNL